MQKLDHNIVFLEKRHFFRRKLAKIAENCDHNIDPSCRQK
jgi:alpha/beta superfamily hydrolase